mgnify:CR=1 FL=1
MDLKAKLEAAGQKAEEQKAERRARVVKGSHLLPEINKLVTESGLKTKDNTGFLIVFGNENGRKICVAKKGGRVDISGFDLSNPAVISITAEEAKEKHLGKVRGQVDFDQDDAAVLGAVSAALASLQEVVEKPAPAKKEKKAKAEKPADAAEAQASADSE